MPPFQPRVSLIFMRAALHRLLERFENFRRLASHVSHRFCRLFKFKRSSGFEYRNLSGRSTAIVFLESFNFLLDLESLLVIENTNYSSFIRSNYLRCKIISLFDVPFNSKRTNLVPRSSRIERFPLRGVTSFRRRAKFARNNENANFRDSSIKN